MAGATTRFAGRVRSLRQRGLWGAAKRVVQVMYRRMMPRRVTPHPFDLEHGVDTGGLLFGKDIPSGHAHDAQNTAYFGSQPSVMQTGLSYWQDELRRAGESPEAFTFIDIGCGKGRALMLASELLPFRRVIGVELSPGMVRIARENLLRWADKPHACNDLSVVEADVLEFSLPEEPILLYMYHPFEADLFGRWVETLRLTLATRNAQLYLLYTNPLFEAQLGMLPNARQVWTGYIQFTREEMVAHLFGGEAERVSLYRLTPPAA